MYIPTRPDKSYGGLVSSIQSIGVTEPVILRLREDGEYQFVAGYRRRRASELAKKLDIPALVYEMTLQEATNYHKKQQLQPTTPIHGKPVPAPAKDADEGKKPDAAPAPAAGKDDKGKPADEGKKPDIPPAPAAGKDDKGKDADEGKKPDVPRAPAAVSTGPAASGPTGTAIKQVFDDRLNPPDDKALIALPIPKEGDSYFITLHPGYLEKSKFNNFEVNREAEDFKEPLKSIELTGVKDPVLARPKEGGGLEILSGQRRHVIASILNYPVPTIIQRIDDDDAKILVADSNLHRPHISSYDLSRALRMKMDGMKHKAGRRKKGDSGPSLNTDEALAKEMGMTVSKLNRIVRLSEATKDVCTRYDEGTLELSIASSISLLKPENQDAVLRLSDLGYKLTTVRVERMKPVEKKGGLTEKAMREILDDKDLAPKQPPTTPKVPADPSLPPSPDVPHTPSTGENPPTPTGNTPLGENPTEDEEEEEEKEKEESDVFKGPQERPENLKVILTGDRLRRYFPDVTITPREIEESVYEALDEREKRREKQKEKDQIFKKGKNGPTR